MSHHNVTRLNAYNRDLANTLCSMSRDTPDGGRGVSAANPSLGPYTAGMQNTLTPPNTFDSFLLFCTETMEERERCPVSTEGTHLSQNKAMCMVKMSTAVYQEAQRSPKLERKVDIQVRGCQ